MHEPDTATVDGAFSIIGSIRIATQATVSRHSREILKIVRSGEKMAREREMASAERERIFADHFDAGAQFWRVVNHFSIAGAQYAVVYSLWIYN
jgi:hypothetical protein